MQHCQVHSTSRSIITTKPHGALLALDKHGAVGGFLVEDDQIDTILDTKIFYVGKVGRMDRIDNDCTVEVMAEAKARGCVTNLDAFASTSENLSLVAPLLPYTNYLMRSDEEAMALSGLPTLRKLPNFFWTKMLAP